MRNCKDPTGASSRSGVICVFSMENCKFSQVDLMLIPIGGLTAAYAKLHPALAATTVMGSGRIRAVTVSALSVLKCAFCLW